MYFYGLVVGCGTIKIPFRVFEKMKNPEKLSVRKRRILFIPYAPPEISEK